MAVERTCRETGAVVREVPVRLDASDADVVAAVRGAVTGRTRLVVLDLITSPTARVMPVAAVHAALRGTGVPLFVDAAHAPGVISGPAPGTTSDPTPGMTSDPTPATTGGPVPAEFWVGNLHKWAYAPRGTALLYVAARWRGRLRTPVVSWREAEGFPGSLEYSGVTDPTAWLAAPVGTYVLRTLGLDQVRRHNAALAAYGQVTVGAALGLAPDDLPEPGGGVALPMRIVPLPPGLAGTPENATVLRRRLADELQAEVQISAWRNRCYLRLSANVYNHADEYDRLADRLPAFLKSLRQ
jgi:isopenicillin-N epimerase